MGQRKAGERSEPSYFRVNFIPNALIILLGERRNQAQRPRALDRLGAALRVQLGEQVGCVGFNGVQRDEHLGGNFLVAQPLGNELQHFVFPLCDAQFRQRPLQCRGIEWLGGRLSFFSLNGHTSPQPKANGRKESRDQAEVQLLRVVHQQQPVTQCLQGCQQ